MATADARDVAKAAAMAEARGVATATAAADARAPATMPPWQRVLDFWFLPDSDSAYGEDRVEWFRKDPAFDASIGECFLADIETAVAGGRTEWDADPRGLGPLARIIVLDQFTRNVFRDTPRAFAGDALALTAATALVDSGRDRLLNRVQRSFVYLPLEHAEDIASQHKGVALYEALGRDTGREGTAEWAIKHRDIIARFGRFPHRNRILGRDLTAEEIEFLKTPGSSF